MASRLGILLATFGLVGTIHVVSLAATQEEIDQAIARGIESLRASQQPDGSWVGYPGHDDGVTSLVGLALLECGVPPSDPMIANAVRFVREKAPACRMTYSLALVLMFLDRQGDLIDGQPVTPLIRSLAGRLLEGQRKMGGWGYGCPASGEGYYDNSNTQFAIYGLWVARRHGVDVAAALAAVDKHFRSTQNQDGGWGYGKEAGFEKSTGSMTCAALLGLATHYGQTSFLRARTDPQQSSPKPGGTRVASVTTRDRVVSRGLAFLAKRLREYRPIDPAVARRNSDPTSGTALVGYRDGSFTQIVCFGYYLLWSIERVAVVYDMDTIGNTDWYAWGSEILINQQQSDGSWIWRIGGFGGFMDIQASCDPVGTGSALLFLRRSNLIPDLTELVTGKAAPQRTSPMRTRRGGQTGQFVDPRSPEKAPARSQRDLQDMTVGEAFIELDESPDGRKTQILDELARRSPKYSEVQDQLPRIWRLAQSKDSRIAAVARRHVVNAFQRAPISHCLYWIGQGNGELDRVIWEQIDGRIARADAARRAQYRDTAVQVVGHAEFDIDGRKAAIELLGRLKDRRAVAGVVDELPDLPNELWPSAGDLLKKLTGEDFGPRDGDGLVDTLAAKRRWEKWLRLNGGE